MLMHAVLTKVANSAMNGCEGRIVKNDGRAGLIAQSRVCCRTVPSSRSHGLRMWILRRGFQRVVVKFPSSLGGDHGSHLSQHFGVIDGAAIIIHLDRGGT